MIAFKKCQSFYCHQNFRNKTKFSKIVYLVTVSNGNSSPSLQITVPVTTKSHPDADSIKLSSRSFDLYRLPLSAEPNDYLKRKTIITESVFPTLQSQDFRLLKIFFLLCKKIEKFRRRKTLLIILQLKF